MIQVNFVLDNKRRYGARLRLIEHGSKGQNHRIRNGHLILWRQQTEEETEAKEEKQASRTALCVFFTFSRFFSAFTTEFTDSAI